MIARDLIIALRNELVRIIWVVQCSCVYVLMLKASVSKPSDSSASYWYKRYYSKINNTISREGLDSAIVSTVLYTL